MADKTNILEKFNNEAILGKFAGDDRRNPSSISQDISGNYQVKQLVYPEDLSNRSDLQHYIVFYINARGKSKFKTEKTIDVDVSTNGQNRVSDRGAADAAILGASIVGGAAGAAASDKILSLGQKAGTASSSSGLQGKIGNILKIASAKTGAAASVLSGAAGGAVAGAGVASLFAFSDSFSIKEPQRVTDAIMLPIESIPSTSYTMKYKDFDLGAIAGLVAGSSAIETNLAGRLAEFGASAVASLGGLSSVAGAGQVANTAKFAAKVASNPFKEVLFEAVDFRSFSFRYTFLPKSEAEVYNVKRIIDLFKFHMHPELSSDGFFYVYPSEFEMQYYYKGQQNSFMHKMSTCVLTDMKVDYGSEYFSSFDNGAPSEIVMSLTFKEVELLTKERIVKGY